MAKKLTQQQFAIIINIYFLPSMFQKFYRVFQKTYFLVKGRSYNF